jgi:hypothetical protein
MFSCRLSLETLPGRQNSTGSHIINVTKHYIKSIDYCDSLFVFRHSEIQRRETRNRNLGGFIL